MAGMRRLLLHIYGAATFSVLFISGIYLSECLTANYKVSLSEIGVSLLCTIAGFVGSVHYATRLRQRRR